MDLESENARPMTQEEELEQEYQLIKSKLVLMEGLFYRVLATYLKEGAIPALKVILESVEPRPSLGVCKRVTDEIIEELSFAGLKRQDVLDFQEAGKHIANLEAEVEKQKAMITQLNVELDTEKEKLNTVHQLVGVISGMTRWNSQWNSRA